MNFLIELTSQQAQDNPGLFYTLKGITVTSAIFVEQQETELLLPSTQTQSIKSIISSSSIFLIEDGDSVDLNSDITLDTQLLEEGDEIELYGKQSFTITLNDSKTVDFGSINQGELANFIADSNGNLNRTVAFITETSPVITDLRTDLSQLNNQVNQNLSNLLSEELIRTTEVNALNTKITNLEGLSASGVRFVGDYDADNNIPELEGGSPGETINKGDLYYVSTTGRFYTQDLEIGDAIIAKQDAPIGPGGWTFIQTNLTAGTIKNLINPFSTGGSITTSPENL